MFQCTYCNGFYKSQSGLTTHRWRCPEKLSKMITPVVNTTNNTTTNNTYVTLVTQSAIGDVSSFFERLVKTYLDFKASYQGDMSDFGRDVTQYIASIDDQEVGTAFDIMAGRTPSGQSYSAKDYATDVKGQLGEVDVATLATETARVAEQYRNMINEDILQACM